MSHTSKIPPAKYATSDLPTDVAVGTIVFDETTSEHKSFNGSSWDAIEGGGIGTQTIVFDSTGPSYDQIQGDIPEDWKNNDTSLKGLVIGTSCTSIGSSAFYYCTNLTGDLVIPDSVTTIEGGSYAGAFLGTSGVTSLTIGNSVTSIGDYAFYLCVGFGTVGDLVIPDSVVSIGYYAFGNCGLTGTLTIGNSVTTIGDYAFGYSSNTRVEILATTAPTIGSNAFSYMSSVFPAEIHVPVGATGYAASYDGLTVVADL